MKKKLMSILIAMLCILNITACGKKSDVENPGQNKYAEQETKDNTASDADSEEVVEHPPLQEYYPSNDEITIVQDNITYLKPKNEGESYYVNDIVLGTTIPYPFIFNDVVASPNENSDKLSLDNNIYCSGYNNELNFTDLTYTMKNQNKSLSKLSPAIEYIKLGDKQFTVDEFIKPIDKLEDLIKFFESNYTPRFKVVTSDIIENNDPDAESSTETTNENVTYETRQYNTDDIYSYVSETIDINDKYGKSYVWRFYVNDMQTEYSAEELKDISDDLNTEITVTAVYNANEKLSYYTIEVKKSPHVWVTELTKSYTKEVGTGEFESKPYNKDGYIIPDEELANYAKEDIIYKDTEIMKTEEVVEPLGIMHKTCAGYDFTNAHVKMKDGSYIGMDHFSITIHNPNLYKDVDYVFN